MEKNNIPKLPRNLIPKYYYWKNENTIVIMTEDENCIHLFEWDGVSVNYNRVNSYLKVDIDIWELKDKKEQLNY